MLEDFVLDLSKRKCEQNSLQNALESRFASSFVAVWGSIRGFSQRNFLAAQIYQSSFTATEKSQLIFYFDTCWRSLKSRTNRYRSSSEPRNITIHPIKNIMAIISASLNLTRSLLESWDLENIGATCLYEHVLSALLHLGVKGRCSEPLK